jgi:glycosyltransferase involved in cell wall biosynthesis
MVMGGRRRASAATSRPRVLMITADVDSVGGIQRYCRTLTDSMKTVADVSLVNVALDGSLAGQSRAFVKGLVRALRTRPDILLITHIGLGPIGLVCRVFGLRYVVVVYGIEVWAEPSVLRRVILGQASGVWAISRFTKSQVERIYPRCRSTRVVGAAVDPRFLTARASPSPEFRILTVARSEHVWYKGVDTCAAAADNLSRDHRVEYRIAGAAAPAGGAVTEESEPGSDGSPVVTWLGEVDEDALLDEYRKANVVVLVSRFRTGRSPAGEGLGLAVLEAGALGVPTIGSAVGGTTDCIADGETGYLVPPDDIPALEDRLRSLIEDPGLRRQMGQNARQWVAERFSPAAFSATLDASLAAALSGPPRRRPRD